MAAVRLHAVLLCLSLCGFSISERYTQKTCQEISVPMCKGIGYNMTYMPNQFNHESQEEAGMEVHQFYPLVEIMCSPDLQFFLCSIYTPICVTNYNKPLPVCRSVCERAKSGCSPLMIQYGFKWPERMRCEDLPEFGDKENLCMDFNMSSSQSAPTTTGPAAHKPGAHKPPGPSARPHTPATIPSIPGSKLDGILDNLPGEFRTLLCEIRVTQGSSQS